jgi:hypothetical protein
MVAMHVLCLFDTCFMVAMHVLCLFDTCFMVAMHVLWFLYVLNSYVNGMVCSVPDCPLSTLATVPMTYENEELHEKK